MMEYSLALQRRVIPQPKPFYNSTGDCGACVLGGLLNLDVPEIYMRYRDGKVEGFTWPAMRTALYIAESDGLMDRIVTDIPCWTVHESHQVWGSPSWCQSLEWFNYIRLAIDAGYYAIAEVTLSRQLLGNPDHWVVICGVRQYINGHSIEQEVLVSCSALSTPAEEWVSCLDFLKTRGGFNVLLARPTEGI